MAKSTEERGEERERERDHTWKSLIRNMYSIYISIVSEHLLLQKTALASSPIPLSLFRSFVFTVPPAPCVRVFLSRTKGAALPPGACVSLCSVAERGLVALPFLFSTLERDWV